MAKLNISSDLQNIIKKIVLDTYYPIGKIYITVGNENPNETIGGTWIKFGSGKCLVSVDTSQTEFSVVEKIGGEKEHTLSASEMPAHKHDIYAFSPESGSTGRFTCNPAWNNRSSDTEGIRWIGESGITGQTTPHNNLQPYITVYMWKRTA